MTSWEHCKNSRLEPEVAMVKYQILEPEESRVMDRPKGAEDVSGIKETRNMGAMLKNGSPTYVDGKIS